MTTPAHATLPTLPATPCYLNGEFSTLKDAKVSVLDRGFIFGDAVYEVVPAYAGRLFRFAQHMARLNRNLAELLIPNPLTQDQWRDIAHKLLADYADATGEKTEMAIGFELRRISRADVLAADELLLSSAAKEILPITRLDGQPVGMGKSGPIYKKLYAAHQQAKQDQST